MKRSMKKFMAMLLAVMMVMGSFSTILAVSAADEAEGCAHNWELYTETPYVEPTCTEHGGTWKKCSICGEVEMQDMKPALGHDYTWTYYNDEETDDCRKAFESCARCGDVKTDFGKHNIQPVDLNKVDADHPLASFVRNHWADCQNEGYIAFECVTCIQEGVVCTAFAGEFQCELEREEIIAADGTTMEHDCETCVLPAGYIYVKVDKLSVNGEHTMGTEPVEVVEADCGAGTPGIAWYECECCFYRESEELQPAHNYIEGELVGCVRTLTCDICGDETTRVEHQAFSSGHKVDKANKTCYDWEKCETCGYYSEETNHINTVERHGVYVGDPDDKTDNKCVTYTDCVDCGGENVKPADMSTHESLREWDDLPSCTAVPNPTWGVHAKACDTCGYAEGTLTDPPFNHSTVENWTVVQDATCTNKGVKENRCPHCDVLLGVEETLAYGHDLSGDAIETYPATCQKPAYEVKECGRCGVQVEVQLGEELGPHEIESYTITTFPTCSTDGIASLWCVRCGQIDGVTYEDVLADPDNYEYTGSDVDFNADLLKKFEHKFHGYALYGHIDLVDEFESNVSFIPGEPAIEVVEYQKPTCAAGGYSNGTCLICDEWVETLLPKKDTHTGAINPVASSYIWADGTEIGGVDVSGQDIADFEYKGMPVKGWLRFPTCTLDGLKWVQCSDCGGKYTETVHGSKFGHEMELIEDGVAPSCLVGGHASVWECVNDHIIIKHKKYTQADADASATDNITDEMVGQNVIVKGVYVFVVSIEDCDYVEYRDPVTGELVDEYSVPAHGHPEDQIDVLETQYPTCTEAGWTEGRTCRLCQTVLKFSEPLPAIGHDYKTVPAREPGCVTIGWKTYEECDICGDKHDYEEIPALGHLNPTKSTNCYPTKVPTCTEAGESFGYECERCGECTGHDVIDAYGHNMVTYTRVITCENYTGGMYHYYAGVMGYAFTYTYCEHCGYSDAGSIVDFEYRKHNIVTETYEPTCTEGGYTVVDMCLHPDCMQGTVVDPVPALGHDIPDHNEEIIDSEKVLCNRCLEMVNAHGDDWVMVLETEYRELQENGLCRVSYYQLWTCTTCEYKTQIITSVDVDQDHEGELIDTRRPTYTEAGAYVYECDCGHVWEEAIPPLTGVIFNYDVTSFNPAIEGDDRYADRTDLDKFYVVNGGYMAIRVSVDADKLEMWSSELVIEFLPEHFEFLEDMTIEENKDNALGLTHAFLANEAGKLKVVSVVSNNTPMNIELSGEDMAYVDLIFRVKSIAYTTRPMHTTECVLTSPLTVVESECKVIDKDDQLKVDIQMPIEDADIYMSGDVTLDGVLDIHDAYAVMEMIANNGPYNTVADLDNDGTVTVADFGELVELILNENLTEEYADLINEIKGIVAAA